MLYLIRHGRAAAGVEDLDPGLDEAGRLQAEAAAEAVRGVGATRLVVSPMRRTQETAAPVARLLGLPAELREEVSEIFEASMAAEARRAMLMPFLESHWSEQPEDRLAWRRRVWDTLVELGTDADVVVVSHYVAICAAVGLALDDDRVLPVAIANGSITTLAVKDGALELVEAGATGHLAPDLITGMLTVLPGRS